MLHQLPLLRARGEGLNKREIDLGVDGVGGGCGGGDDDDAMTFGVQMSYSNGLNSTTPGRWWQW